MKKFEKQTYNYLDIGDTISDTRTNGQFLMVLIFLILNYSV